MVAGIATHWLVPNGATAQSGFVGSQSCSASTCHGNAIGLGEPWNHSLSEYFASDPHVSAGLVLQNAESQRIVRRLDHTAVFPSVRYDQVLRQRCISCHVTATQADCASTSKLSKDYLAQGVSCESCHGPASDWLGPHVKTSFDSVREATSIRDTGSIVGRSQTCARCHIGNREEDGLVRDMNHDLVAAGHPVLRFDLIVYSENMSQHWSRDAKSHQDFYQSSIATRRVSRWVNLSAAGKLAADRAKASESDPSVPWPELSDYDCFGCHQNIDSFAPNTSLLKISGGLPVWNPWHLINNSKSFADSKSLSSLTPHQSDPKDVIVAGNEIADRMLKMAMGKLDRIDPRSEIETVLAGLREQPPHEWNEAALVYLQLDAAVRDLRSASQSASSQRLESSLREVFELLRFPSSESGEVRFDSPGRFDSTRFRESVLRLFPSPELPQ